MIIGERYRVLRPIKTSGMSRVLLAEDLRLKMKWAIKVISCKEGYLADQVISEANVLRKIKHPNLVRIMDIFKWENNACLVMEYVEGKNLSELIRDNPSLVRRNFYNFILPVMHALESLHDGNKPLIYRDMKPENIIIRPDLSPCLIDFGTSKQYSSDKKDIVSLGTKGFAPPEQFKGVTDVRSDIYSLGRTMEKMAGASPERAISLVIKKATKEEPEKRYKSVKEMEKDLLSKKAFKGRLLILCAAFLVLTVVIGALRYGYRERQANALVADAYRRTIESGNEAVYNGEYLEAEQFFTKAIVDINGYEEEGYLRLLSLYRKTEAPLDGLMRMDSYIDSGYGNTDKMSSLLFECGITAAFELKDYKKSAHYFSMTDKEAFPEAAYLTDISEYLSGFDSNPSGYMEAIRDFRDYTDTLPDPDRKIRAKLIYADSCLTLSGGTEEYPEASVALLNDAHRAGSEAIDLINENGGDSESELKALEVNASACRLLGEKLPKRRQEYFKEALSLMEKAGALSDSIKNSAYYLSMAGLYRETGDKKNALSCYEKAEKSGYAAAYTEHMKYLEAEKKYGQLMRVYKRSLSADGIQGTKEFQKLSRSMEKLGLLKG